MRLYELLTKEMFDQDDFDKVFDVCPTCKQKKSKCQCELDEDVVDTNESYLDITQSKKEEIISAWEWQENMIKIGNGMLIIPAQKQDGTMHKRPDPDRPGEFITYNDNDALLIDKDFKVVDSDTDIEDLLNNNFGIIQGEGKSPHKKGTAKYKKHMAAMHAEATLQTGGYGKPKKSRHQQKI